MLYFLLDKARSGGPFFVGTTENTVNPDGFYRRIEKNDKSNNQ